MVRKKDVLAGRIEQLEWIVDAEFPGREWAERIEVTLGSVEHALRRHVKETEANNGLYSEVDRTRPSLERQLLQLRQQHRDFMDKVSALREEARRTRTAFLDQCGSDPAWRSHCPVDCSNFLHRVEEFVAMLQDHKKKETDLVLESVDTDIGVGD